MTYDMQNPPDDYTGNADAINDAQNSAINSLREKIQSRKALYEAEQAQKAIDPILVPVREVQPLPEITVPIGEYGEFSYDRFIEIQKRLDVAYGNYLIEKNLETFNTEKFEEKIKDLVRTVDSYIEESLRVRY